MGVALFIVAEREVEGLDTFVDGKALAHCRPVGSKGYGRAAARHLGVLAERAGVRPLEDFYSIDPEEARSMIEDSGAEPPEGELPPEQWYPASEGLQTVRGLIEYLKAHPDAAAEVDRLLEDLRQFEEVLGQLEAAGVRWHLVIDT